MHEIWHQIVLWFQAEYLPAHGPFYMAQIWGNVFVAPVAFGLGWFWSKSRWWPLKPIEKGFHLVHKKLDNLDNRHDEHDKHLTTILERLDAQDKVLAAQDQDHQELSDSLHKRLDHHDTLLKEVHKKLDRKSHSSPVE